MDINTMSKHFQFKEFETGPFLFVREPNDRTRCHIVNRDTYTPFISLEKTNYKTNFPKYRILLELGASINRKFIYNYLETEEKEYLADIAFLEHTEKAFGWERGEIIDMKKYLILYGLMCGGRAA